MDIEIIQDFDGNENDTQRKRWLLTFDNIDKHGISHDILKECLGQFNCNYYCMADEKTDSGMLHTHLYFETVNNCRFSTVKNRFPEIAHIDRPNGTASECRDYIRKEGKYLNSEKSLTSLPDTFEENGSYKDIFGSTANNIYKKLIELVEQGLTNYEIIKIYPNFAFRIKEIENIRFSVLTHKYANEKRNLNVTYIFGPINSGKTDVIYKKYKGEEICRITNYKKDGTISFDSYSTQKVLVFDNFYGQVPIEEMISYLEGYPIYLPARYSDHVACYLDVYIISNIDFEKLYSFADKTLLHYFKEKFNCVLEFKENNFILEHEI